jgi:hypothetical protein
MKDQCNDRIVRRNLLVRVSKLDDEQWTVFEGDTPILESVVRAGAYAGSAGLFGKKRLALSLSKMYRSCQEKSDTDWVGKGIDLHYLLNRFCI